MVIGVGQRCVVRVKIADVELRNARDIVATVESPQCVAHCQEVSFDEVSGLVYVVVDVNSAGPYSMWLEVRFAKEIVYTPAFEFAEVEGEAAPCDAPYIVDVEVAGESVTITPPKVDVDGGGGSSITVDTELSDTSNNAIANSAVAKALITKQDTLTLTTKSNGNIVIGNLAGQSKEFMPATPSGDQGHYLYVAAGATWNDITGYWELNGLTDIDNAEMRKIYNFGFLRTYSQAPFYGEFAKIRTNLPRIGSANTLGWDFYLFAYYNDALEVLNLLSDSYEGVISTTRAMYAFEGCSKLREIYGILLLEGDNTGVFSGCNSLSRLRVKGLKADISFAQSPLSKESLLYLINNCASEVSFTIILRPDEYAKCIREEDYEGEWWQDIDDAMTDAELTKQTRITLASA